MKPKIDEEFKGLCPPLSDDERAKLEENIKAEGCREALVIWGGVLLDGHNRLEICERNGIDYSTKELEFEDRAAAKIWIRNNQMGRRNLTAAWRIELQMQNDEDLRRRGRAKYSESVGRPKKSLSTNDNDLPSEPKPKHDTRGEIAKAAKVSTGQVAMAQQVRKSDPKAWEKAKAGEVSISAAYKTIQRDEREKKREKKRKENAEKVSSVSPKSLLEQSGVFSTIVIDPPWDWGDEGDENQMGRAKPDYSTMSIEELEKLPVGDVSAEDAHLYLWITNRSLPKGFRLIQAWGFRYITAITWVKESFGMGNYFRGQTEHILFAVKGSLPIKRKDAATILRAKRPSKSHSAKPVEAYDLFESCSPGPYLEMFSRSQRKGWHSWGENGDV